MLSVFKVQNMHYENYQTLTINPLLPELRKIFLKIFSEVILFRMGRKIYMIFSKSLIKKKFTLRRPWAARQVN